MVVFFGMAMTSDPYWWLNSLDQSATRAKRKKRGFHSVRILAIPVLAAGIVGFLFQPNCPNNVCPSYALANPWILRGERSLALVVGALVVGSILWRMLFMGQMPNKLGSGGIEFTEVVEVTKESLADLERSVETLKGEAGELKKLISRSTTRSMFSIQEIYKRLEVLEKDKQAPE
jgi:hypothetical protein